MTSSRPFPPRLPEQNASVLARQAFAGSRAGRVRNADPLVSMGRIVARASAGASSIASSFWYEDNFTVSSTSPGTFALTYLPRDNSEDIKVNGVGLLPTTEWTRSGTTLTVNSSVWLGLTGSWDLTVQYEVLSTVSVPLGLPAVPGTPLLWLKADALALTDGAQVASWTDSGTHGNDMVQATSALRPIYKTNLINGLPGVRFDGTTSALNCATMDPGSSGNFTVYAVFNPHTFTTAYSFQTFISGYGANCQMLFAINTSEQLATGDMTGGGGTYTAQSTATVTTGAWNSAAARYTFPNAAPEFTLNGSVSTTTGTLFSTWFAGAGMSVGWNNRFADDFFQGDIAELIYYDSTLSNDDHGAVLSYINAKYGI